MQASSTAHIAPIHDHCFQDENHCHSGNREKDAAQFKGEQPYHEAQQARQNATANDLHHQRCRNRFEKHNRGIGPHRNEGRHAKIHIACVAAQDVPCGCQYDKLQDDEASKENVFVDVHQGQS